MINKPVSYSRYDSSVFPTIPQSIKHAFENPLLIENLSNHIITSFDSELVRIQEPNCAIKEGLSFFDNVIKTIEVPESEFYRPEITALRLYGNADFWWLIMQLNDIHTILKYNSPIIRYIPSSELIRIEKFTNNQNNINTIYTEHDEIEVIL